MEVSTKIRKEYSTLSKVNKRIADHILHFPSEVIKQTASEIGEASDASSATVVRFVKKMGYSGLEDLKVSLASEQVVKESDHIIDPIVSSEDTLDVLCGKVETLIKETTTDVFAGMDQEVLRRAIESVKKARKIHLFGIGSSSLIAYDLFHKFNRAGKEASFVFDSHIGLETLTYATDKDVVIAVTYSGHTMETLLACEYAKQKGVHLIIITRNDGERISRLADEILKVPANEHLLRVGAISSLYASMIVGTVLYLGVIQEDIENSIEENMIITKNWVSPLKEE